jgi:hypothetical protein
MKVVQGTRLPKLMLEGPVAHGIRIELKVGVVMMRHLVIVGVEHGPCSVEVTFNVMCL